MKRKCRRSPLIKNLVCVSDGDTVERLDRDEAAVRVTKGWYYVPKNVWRRTVQ